MIKRTRQGLRALLTWVRPVNDTEAARLLPPPLYALFCQMRTSERQHSLNVLRAVRAAGYDHPTLAAAALLHDCGKSQAAYHLWDKVIVVLVTAAAPRLAQQLGKAPTPTGWRRPFVVRQQHPRWGAEMVAAAGGDDLLVYLIADHGNPHPEPPQTEAEHLMAALQAADDAN